MMRRRPQTRRRVERRVRDPLPLDKTLEIIELLAKHPMGLTAPEIATRLGAPAASVIHTIAILQRRQWLQVAPGNESFSLGPRVMKMEDGKPQS